MNTKNQNFSLEKRGKKAFTLVELIIVITILAILATIAFVSFQNYAKDSRDAVRVSDLASTSKWLSIFFTKSGVYPETESGILITANGTTITKQGKLWENVVIVINMNQVPLDPMDQTKYTYSTNSSRTKYELLGYTENSNYVSLLPQTFAVNYAERWVNLVGDELGIILNWDNTLPSGDVETSTGSKTYKVLFDNSTQFESSGNLVFSQIYNMRDDLLKKKELASLDDSLVGYWDMETLLAYWSVMTWTWYQLKDLSKYWNHGSCFNGSNEVSCWWNVGWPQIVNENGKTGKAMSFDGVDDGSIPLNSSLKPSKITVIAISKSKTKLFNTRGSIVSWRSGEYNGYIIHPNKDTKNLTYYIWNSWTRKIDKILDFDIENLSFFWFTYDWNKLKWYLNWNINWENYWSWNITYSSDITNLWIWYDTCCSWRFWNVVIDEVRIYNRALSESEIKALYSAPK